MMVPMSVTSFLSGGTSSGGLLGASYEVGVNGLRIGSGCLPSIDNYYG